MKYNAVFKYKSKKEDQAIKYLQYCVSTLKIVDPVIHNFLLSIYAEQEDDTLLLQFLKEPNIFFDLKYALRLFFFFTI